MKSCGDGYSHYRIYCLTYILIMGIILALDFSPAFILSSVLLLKYVLLLITQYYQVLIVIHFFMNGKRRCYLITCCGLPSFSEFFVFFDNKATNKKYIYLGSCIHNQIVCVQVKKSLSGLSGYNCDNTFIAVCIYRLVMISIDLSETGHFGHCARI